MRHCIVGWVKQLKKIILASLTLEDICPLFQSETTHPTTYHHIPEDLNTINCCENIKYQNNGQL